LRKKKIINDQQASFGEELVDFFSALELGSFEEILEEDMCFTVDDFVDGFSGGPDHGFGDLSFPDARGNDQECVMTVSTVHGQEQGGNSLRGFSMRHLRDVGWRRK